MIREKEMEWLNRRITLLSYQVEQYKHRLSALEKQPTEEVQSIEVLPETPIFESDFSVRVQHALGHLEIKTIGDLASITEEEWRRLPNLGWKSIREIEEFLWSCGFKMEKKR